MSFNTIAAEQQTAEQLVAAVVAETFAEEPVAPLTVADGPVVNPPVLPNVIINEPIVLPPVEDKTIKYVPDDLEARLLSIRVPAINFAAHPAGAASATGCLDKRATPASRTNHWVFHMLLADGKGSIRVDLPSDGATPSKAVVVIRELPYQRSNNEVKTCTVRLCEGITAGALVETIKSRGWDRYQFAGSGQGCRHWNLLVVLMLKEGGFITSQIDEAVDGLHKVWLKGGVLAPREAQTGVVPGSFY